MKAHETISDLIFEARHARRRGEIERARILRAAAVKALDAQEREDIAEAKAERESAGMSGPIGIEGGTIVVRLPP